MTDRAGKYWSTLRKAAKKRGCYEAQRGLCAGCHMPWEIGDLNFHFVAPDPDRTFDLRCGPCKDARPKQVAFLVSRKWRGGIRRP